MSAQTSQSFETDRLLLTPVQAQDSSLIYALMNSPLFVQYVGDRGITSEAAAEAYITANLIPQRERLGFSSFVIVRKTDHAAVGTCGLVDRKGLEGIDLGYALLPAYHGQGFAQEAAGRLLQAAFETYKLPKVSAITDPENTGSQRVLLKLGFEPKGTTTLPGEDKELLLFEKRP